MPPAPVPARPACLLLPGLGGSGADHWQTAWERERGHRRVDFGDWDAPDRSRWVARLAAELARYPDPVLLVAHSLGSVAVAWWADAAGPTETAKVRGAFLVAPPDLDRPDAPPATRGFASPPRRRLPFPAMLVASRDDPYASFAFQAALARDWGARLVDVGALGHINARSGLNGWPEGHALLDDLSA